MPLAMAGWLSELNYAPVCKLTMCNLEIDPFVTAASLLLFCPQKLFLEAL